VNEFPSSSSSSIFQASVLREREINAHKTQEVSQVNQEKNGRNRREETFSFFTDVADI